MHPIRPSCFHTFANLGCISIKRDSGEGAHRGHHHFIPLSLVAEVEGQKVRLSANSDVAVTFEEEKSEPS
ncbi:DUF2171 domain-containing protein [Mesorhizobium sp. M1428]|uniref:DUF2171 domain-containing protein n=1 Tax=Mesorhizobium sp. M1428 TaxID=2957102 RepID=UPI003336F8C1